LVLAATTLTRETLPKPSGVLEDNKIIGTSKKIYPRETQGYKIVFFSNDVYDTTKNMVLFLIEPK
jgi:hypothetical protein